MGPSDRRPFRAGGIMVASREARPDTRRRERSGSRDIWPRPLRALSTASTRAEEAESEWYQWLELKKPVDWEPHTSLLLPRDSAWLFTSQPRTIVATLWPA